MWDLYILNVILSFVAPILFQVVIGSKETLDSNVTSSGDTTSGEISAAASNSISKHRREVLIRQPSYCKILDDLQGTEEKVLKQATAKMKGQHNVLEVIYIYYEDLRQYYPLNIMYLLKTVFQMIIVVTSTYRYLQQKTTAEKMVRQDLVRQEE